MGQPPLRIPGKAGPWHVLVHRRHHVRPEVRGRREGQGRPVRAGDTEAPRDTRGAREGQESHRRADTGTGTTAGREAPRRGRFGGGAVEEGGAEDAASAVVVVGAQRTPDQQVRQERQEVQGHQASRAGGGQPDVHACRGRGPYMGVQEREEESWAQQDGGPGVQGEDDRGEDRSHLHITVELFGADAWRSGEEARAKELESERQGRAHAHRGPR
mmetsp:Transcript_32524/g.78742  ORF Transcript_32524/g.78742 Transcript_32524/m.78742 type:complete len:215 (-) Transcript_32524:648-1292(-)